LEKQLDELKLNVIINDHDDFVDPTKLEFNQRQESFYLEACMVLIEMLNAYESVKYDDIPLEKFENFQVNRIQRKIINCFIMQFTDNQNEKNLNAEISNIIKNAESSDE
jgi:hypothetical protein